MYSTRSGLILGFHGCDISVRDKLVNGKSELNFSENTFDWLGHGIYFWEYGLERAYEYAQTMSTRKNHSNKIKKPAALGAVLDLGFYFDLVEYKNLQFLKNSYQFFRNTQITSGFILPENKSGGSLTDFLLRDLDCAVIESIHQTQAEAGLPSFDSVKGVFIEVNDLYPSAGFKEKNHVQICIRNPNCIKGSFLPRNLNDKHPSV